MYTTGDVAGAVKVFLGLLRGSSASICEEARTVSSDDKIYVDDFRVALSVFLSLSFAILSSLSILSQYLKSTEASKISGDLELPFKVCVSKHSRPRYVGDTNDNAEIWTTLQDDWNTFWRTKGGKEILSPAGSYSVNGHFSFSLGSNLF
jgi:hypothetical protein